MKRQNSEKKEKLKTNVLQKTETNELANNQSHIDSIEFNPQGNASMKAS